MAERRDFTEFLEASGGVLFGCALAPGEVLPETYQDLVQVMGSRLNLKAEDVSLDGLCRWLLNGNVSPSSCSPKIDAEHVEAVILIGELPTPDEYVARLPVAPDNKLVLPPPPVVRELLSPTINPEPEAN